MAELSLHASAHPGADEVGLDAEQCAHLIGDAEADEIIAHLKLDDPTLMEDHSPAAAHRCIVQGLKCAGYARILCYFSLTY
jgi:hypothetical protein